MGLWGSQLTHWWPHPQDRSGDWCWTQQEELRSLPCPVPQFPLLVNGRLQPTMPTAPSGSVALGHAVSPLRPAPSATWWHCLKRFLCSMPTSRPPRRDLEEGVSGRNHVHLGITISSFFFLCFLFSCFTMQALPGGLLPGLSVTGDLLLTKHLCQTQESRALLGHHLKLNPPVVKIAFSVKFL